MSGWRRRFGVGAGAVVVVGVVADMSLSAGWLSVDCGVGGLCPSGLGLRSLWALEEDRSSQTQHCSRTENKVSTLSCRNKPAGARGAFVDGEEEPGGADLLELSLLAGVEEDHG